MIGNGTRGLRKNYGKDDATEQAGKMREKLNIPNAK